MQIEQNNEFENGLTSIIDKQDQSEYSIISKKESIFRKIDMYLGSTANVSRNVRIFENSIMSHKLVSISKAIERSFDEILNNAGQCKVPSIIKITMNEDTISIENECNIPCIPHMSCKTNSDSFQTILDLIFGKSGSGSNDYDSNFRNCLGCKLTNIISDEFIVELGDNINGVYQRIIWHHNMTEKVSSICTPPYIYSNGEWKLDESFDRYNGNNYIRVTWKQDFSCGKLENDIVKTHYSEEDILFYTAKSVDASFSFNKVVIFNGILIDYRNIINYASLFTNIDHSIIYISDNIELVIFDSFECGKSISFVNGLSTNEGVHVNETYRVILNLINESFPDKDFSTSIFNLLKQNISVIIKYNCFYPEFSHSSKYTFLKPTPLIILDKNNIEILKKWKSFEIIMS